MRKYLYIPALIFLYLLCSSRSCDNSADRESQKVQVTRDSIRVAAATAEVTPGFLKAADITASQKLRDLFDYISLLNDSTLDHEFRQQTGILIKSLFSDSGSLQLSPFTGNMKLSPDEFLSARPAGAPGKLKMQLLRVMVAEPAAAAGDSIYRGRLTFSYAMPPGEPGRTYRASAGYLLCRINKEFGNEKARTWKVFLDQVSDNN